MCGPGTDRGVPHTHELHLGGDESRDVRVFRPGASVTGASIVRHDPSRPGLGLEEGVTMRSAPQPTTHSEPGRFVATAEVDGDWGFALRNSFGETFYEMGSGEDAPMWGKSCPDARTFRQRLGKVVRTLAPRLKKPLGLEEEEAERHASFVFGSCDKRCDEAEWAGDAPAKTRPTDAETATREGKEPRERAPARKDARGPAGPAPAREAPSAKAGGSARRARRSRRRKRRRKRRRLRRELREPDREEPAGSRPRRARRRPRPPPRRKTTRGFRGAREKTSDATNEKGEGKAETPMSRRGGVFGKRLKPHLKNVDAS